MDIVTICNFCGCEARLVDDLDYCDECERVVEGYTSQLTEKDLNEELTTLDDEEALEEMQQSFLNTYEEYDRYIEEGL